MSDDFAEFLASDLCDDLRHLRAPPHGPPTHDHGARLEADPPVGRGGVDDEPAEKATGLDVVRHLDFGDTPTVSKRRRRLPGWHTTLGMVKSAETPGPLARRGRPPRGPGAGVGEGTGRETL